MSKTNNVRSSQILSPFGVGQIVNFPGELSVMICGLSLWDETITRAKINQGVNRINESELRFYENRLQSLLDVSYFVKPFAYKTSGAINNRLQIPAVRFPGWHHCTNSKCGRMKLVPLDAANFKIECTSCWDGKSKYKFKMMPVRFVAACPYGHIQDVPFKEWVHNGPVPNDGNPHELSYHTGGGSGDLGSITLKCTCNERRSLAGLMNIRKDGEDVFDSALARIGFKIDDDYRFDKDSPNEDNPLGEYCKGHRPWLGLDGVKGSKGCKNHLQVLVRGASNVHFSEIQSAIYLPEGSTGANEYVLKVIDEIGKDQLKSYFSIDQGTVTLPAILGGNQVVLKGFISNENLLSGVIAEINNDDSKKEESAMTPELKLRFEEYEYLLAGRDSENADFKAIVKTFDGYSEQALLEKYFENVVLIEKLKETRVFKGFSRINPNNKIKKEELSNTRVNWLPAVEVYGEGIFLKFKDDVVDNWLKELGNDFSNIISRYHSAMRKRRPEYEDREINPFFVAMHTFSHLLIKRLCFDCGYGSSSLRERLYFSSDLNSRMNGILIYTSSGDSEGSLGGLVRQGKTKNLGRLVKKALEEARWCSADPVCSDIGNSSGQGPDNVNGSACHNCCIVPETSCEEFNVLLDRTTIIGTLDNKDMGFFT
jgi:hypothetical protein